MEHDGAAADGNGSDVVETIAYRTDSADSDSEASQPPKPALRTSPPRSSALLRHVDNANSLLVVPGVHAVRRNYLVTFRLGLTDRI